MKRYLVYFVLAASLWGCKKNQSVETPVPEVKDSVKLISVKILAKNNPGRITTDINATISEDGISALVPSIQNNKKLIITFVTKNARITVNDTIQASDTTLTDFARPVNYKLTSPKGTTKTYTFRVKNFTGIPILYVTTSGPVVSKDDYVKGSLIINTNNQYEQLKQNIKLQIKGRGNSTWGMEKKPYRLKFSDKAEMLGMKSAKNWVLLANYSDKTLLRTSLAFDLGNKIGADFTPNGRFVELVMNDLYLGNYFLTYQVEVDENRVNIAELEKVNNAPNEITGGYLLELDQRRDEDARFETNTGLPFTVKSPEDITPEQMDYIHTYIQQTEDAIFSEDFADPEKGYAKYINVTSFINWFFVQELMKNQDAKDFSSMYYYKDRNGKLGMGPLWDFDLGAGNNDYSESRYPTGWWVKDGPWFKRLFEDPVFKAKVKKRWGEIRNKEIQEIALNINTTVEYIKLSQQQNFTKWPILDKYVWPNQFVLGTYPNEVQQLKKWLNERISWLDEQIGSF